MSYKSKDKRVMSDSKLITGIQKILASSPPLEFSGKTMTIAEIVAMLEARITAAEPVVTAKAAWQAAAAQERELVQQTQPNVLALRAYLVSKFGQKPDQLAEFGLAPRKRRVLTSAELAQKASKARATRQAHAHPKKVEPKPVVEPTPAPQPAPVAGK
jgi:hypothetical protein